jgi:formate C-acetyltransferase
MPLGGIRVVKAGLEAYGYQLDRQTEEIFTKYRKTHNDGVFDVYTRSMRLARRSGIITGLPGAYGRGRIIGDYLRTAAFGSKGNYGGNSNYFGNGFGSHAFCGCCG